MSTNRDHEAHENILALHDEIRALREEVASLRRTVVALTHGQRPPVQALSNFAISPGVRKYERTSEDREVNDVPALPTNDEDADREADTGDEMSSVDEFAMIDQIPPSDPPRPQAYVVIDTREPYEALRTSKKSPKLKQRPQPARDVMLQTPHTSIEANNSKSGTLWTADELRKLRKGLKKKLNDRDIQLQ